MRKEVRLSVALTPPLAVPLRFFLTAPVFAILATVLLLVSGPVSMESRWTTTTLAATHFLTLGYITMVMLGALFQLFPVLLGSPVPHASLVSKVTHALLSLGIIFLVLGFLLGHNWLLTVAMLLLTAAFTLFLVAAIFSLLRAPIRVEHVVVGLIFSVACLLETVVFGLTLAGQRAGFSDTPWSPVWTDMHLAFGLVGWCSLTLISVAYVVVPMFQLTHDYPRSLVRWLKYLIIIFLAIWSTTQLSTTAPSHNNNLLLSLFSSIVAIGLATFAVLTLYLQFHRRIVAWDATVYFWRIAMLFLLGCCILWIVSRYVAPLHHWQNLNYLLGTAFIVGFLISAINGMLYKIVPFLVWYHLQYNNHQLMKLPKMREIIPVRNTRRQLYCHVSATITLLLSASNPVWWFFYPAVILFMLSAALLFYNLIRTMRYYQKTLHLLDPKN